MYLILFIISLWVAGSAFIFGLPSSPIDLVTVLIIAAVMIIGSGTGIKMPDKNSLSKMILFGAALLTFWAVSGFFRDIVGIAASVNSLIFGIIMAFLAYMITQIFPFSSIVAYDRSGSEMSRMSKIHYKNGEIVIKAVLLGSMPATLIIRPVEVWKALSIVDFSIIANIFALLNTGRKQAKELARQEKK